MKTLSQTLSKTLAAFCILHFAFCLSTPAQVGGKFIGSGVTPSSTARGIARDIYIAVRTDGRAGTGTADDPWDGSTAAKFDTRFRAATTESAVIHLGPGTFRTGGSTNLADDIFAANKSFVVLGAGIGVTTLKLQTNAASGTSTNVYILRNSGNSGNVTYFELSHLTLDVDAANQTLISGAGEADVGAVKVHCERGYLHDLNVIGVYGNPAEKFPVALNTRSIGAVAVNGHHVIERVKVVPTAGAASDDMTCISMGDPAWDSVAGQISGAIRDCVVIGTGSQVALGGYNLNGVLVQGNYVTNCQWGWVTDSYTNRNVTITGNRFAYVTTGASFTGNAVSNGRFIFNTLENPVGGATVFGSSSSWDAVFGNAIEAGYALNLGETAVVAGLFDTNYFTLLNATNLSLFGNLTNWSKLATNAISGGAGTFEATQFGTGGGATNFKAFAAVTNLQAASGSYAAPAYGFLSETNTGVHWATTEQLVIGVTGLRAAMFSPQTTWLGASNLTRLELSGATNNATLLNFSGTGKQRWLMGRNSNTESTGNAGSDFTLDAYSDDGVTLIDSPFTIERVAAGKFTVNRPFWFSTNFQFLTYGANTLELNAYTNGVFQGYIVRALDDTNVLELHRSLRLMSNSASTLLWANANKDVSAVTVGAGLSFAAGELSATGGSGIATLNGIGTNTTLYGLEMRGVLTNAAGSTAAPSVTFTNDTDTGFFSGGDGIVTLTVNNANKLEFRDTYIGSAVVYRAADGSGSAPSLTFGASTDIGLFYAGTASQLGIAAGGAEAGRVSTNNFLWGLTATPTSLAKGLVFGDGTGATADPASGVASWAYLGSPQYRGTNTTSGGGGNTNWLHNAAGMVVGAGTDYSAAASYARVDFGTTDVQVDLPTAGTYALDAVVMWNINSASALSYKAKLYNSTDAADVANSERTITAQTTGADYHDANMLIQTVVTVTAGKTIQIYATCGEPMTIFATNTTLRYIRLY